jgi:membrane-associated protein
MDSVSEFVLSAIAGYGPSALGLALLLAAAGVPLPSTFLVVASGAFVRQGYLDPFQAAAFGLAGAVLGDSLSFGMGRLANGWVQRRFGSSPTWARARGFFDRYAGLAIYLSRFLLTSIAIPINLIAGGSGYRLRRFLIFDILGEITWVAGFGYLGYSFGSQWEAVTQAITDFGGLAAGVLLLAGGIYIALRMRKRQ